LISSTEYYRTDVDELFFDALLFAREQVTKIAEETRSVPWAILASQTLVQMACILALDERDSTQTACLSDAQRRGKPSIREATVALLHSPSSQKLPEPFLASPASLLKRVQDTNDVMGLDALVLSDQMKADLSKLNNFRDKIAHYVPHSWSLELSGMPRIFSAAFEFALSTINTPGTYAHRFDAEKRASAKEMCLEMIKILKGET
tara:strand:- start:344 stop:958 length:615 start_codon:yes stop_codon:yes gene_type:complete